MAPVQTLRYIQGLGQLPPPSDPPTAVDLGRAARYESAALAHISVSLTNEWDEALYQAYVATSTYKRQLHRAIEAAGAEAVDDQAPPWFQAAEQGNAQRMDQLAEQIAQIDQRMDRLAEQIAQLDQRITQVADQRVDDIGT